MSVDRDELTRLHGLALEKGLVIDRTGRGLLRLTGPQRIWFLQNTVTADVESIGAGRSAESCFLTPKGKLVAHFRVGVAEEEVWLDIDPPADDLAEWFVRYRFRTKVEIDDRSDGVTTVIGPPAGALAGDGEIRSDGSSVVFGSRLGDLAVADVHGDDGSADASLERAPADVLDVFRLEAGIARFGVDYDTSHLPQEAGLTRTVSVEKGCYVGQETVARIHFRGHVNRVVRPLRFDATDEGDLPGRPLLQDGQKVGTVTSAAWSPRLGVVGIGMVRVEPLEGTSVQVEGKGTATVGPIPEGTKVKIG